ncbi:hypothetical protein ACH427_31890 [Streptomyces sp. NPDC020379]|uniref:terpene synthase family protein n=1 Tax=Streptomyces sp. NPDC020379 TaxID=3365071 RepID=UPI003790CD16
MASQAPPISPREAATNPEAAWPGGEEEEEEAEAALHEQGPGQEEGPGQQAEGQLGGEPRAEGAAGVPEPVLNAAISSNAPSSRPDLPGHGSVRLLTLPRGAVMPPVPQCAAGTPRGHLCDRERLQRHGCRMHTRDVMSIVIPKRFCCPFPLAINPYTGRVAGQMWGWIDKENQAPTESARERARRSCIDLACSFTWPDAERDVLFEGVKWMFLFFRFDDQLEEGAVKGDPEAVRRGVDELVGILQGAGQPSDSTLSQALARTWEHTQQGRPRDWLDQFSRHYCELLLSYTDQSRYEYVPGRRDQLGMADWEDWREISFGMDWCYDFMEPALGSFLPHEVRQLPSMLRLRRSASLHMGMLNDVFSTPRESFQDRQFNSIAIIQRDGRCTPQEAVEVVSRILAERVDQFHAAREDLLRDLAKIPSSSADRAATEAFMDNVAEMIRGNHDWHYLVMRYETDDVASRDGAFRYPDDLGHPPSTP